MTYCLSCVPATGKSSLNTLFTTALTTTVLDPARASNPRVIIVNTGALRFDLFRGAFTADDAFIVAPFADEFLYLPNVSAAMAAKVLPILNKEPVEKRRAEHEHHHLAEREVGALFPQLGGREVCGQDFFHSPLSFHQNQTRLYNENHDHDSSLRHRGDRGNKRDRAPLTPGYTTTDDFGAGGDDTPHSKIAEYPQPNYLQTTVNTTLPPNTSSGGEGAQGGEVVDLIFVDFIGSAVVAALGQGFSEADIGVYNWTLSEGLEERGGGVGTIHDVLPEYARRAWVQPGKGGGCGGG